MRTLQLDLDERSYPVFIGMGLVDQPDLLRKHIAAQQVLLVSNETVAPLYLDRVQASLGNLHHDAVVLPDGEQYKNLETLNTIFDALLEKRFDRSCTVIALGGGVIGDMAGFAAACYQRGVDYIQIPTTLLAQVDSSVGGKTAVNHPQGKNMIGAFYQPRCVIIDTNTLTTLPERELSAGLAEVIKYGIVWDADFFTWLEANMDGLLTCQPEALAYAIERCCCIKADIVAQDERESDVRALLNLGHTFGHAIEAGLGYGQWLHGEAVAAGTMMAADLSARIGWIDENDVRRIRKLLEHAKLPVNGPSRVSNDDYFRLMAVDKKVRDNRLRFILIKQLGQGVMTDAVDRSLVAATLDACRSQESSV